MGIMATPYKDPKSDIYYIRIAVPQDVRKLIGKREFKKSLGTRNEREANIKALPFKEDAYGRIEQARRELSGDHDVSLSPKDCASIAERWYARMRHEIESTGDVSAFLTVEDDVDIHGNNVKRTFGLLDTLALSGSEISRASVKQLNELADDLEPFISEQLSLDKIVVSKGTSTYHQIARCFHKYVVYLDKLCFQRDQENWSFEPVKLSLVDHKVQKVSGKTQSKTKPVNSLTEVFKKFKTSRLLHSDSNPKVAKTVNETELNIERLVSLLGDKDIKEVSLTDLVSFRDTLLQLSSKKTKAIRDLPILKQVEVARKEGLKTLSKKTVKRNFNMVSSVFTFAVENGFVNENLALRVKPPKSDERKEAEEDKGLSEEQLKRLFAHPLFIDPNAPKKYGMACYWVLLLCRYTGARSGEMLQLRKSDVTVNSEGIHYMNVRRGEDQYVKTDSSLRHIPLHSHLIELGFLDFVAQADDWLFSEVPSDKYGSKAPYFTRWWRDRLDEVSIDVNQPTHVFRHTIKTELRALRVGDRINDSITGHTSGSVGDSYGGVPLKTKQEVLHQIPRLDLKRIF